jgi:hypothetical protein
MDVHYCVKHIGSLTLKASVFPTITWKGATY